MSTENSPIVEGEDGAPVLIPLHNESSSVGNLPEWALIELNGELIAPPPNLQVDKENPANVSEDSILPKSQVELGSVRFVNDVSARRRRVSLVSK
eukprot:scaffold18039_cov166-Amphora_coffeaeformis.AAC.1